MDLLIVTSHNEFENLKDCLNSINKYASGFRNVIVVCDNSGDVIPESVSNIMSISIIYKDVPEEYPSNLKDVTYYFRKQYLKLGWTEYTNAKSVLVLCGDEIFTKQITASELKDDEGKFRWFYRNWEDSGPAIKWKQPTRDILKFEPSYEAMCLPGFVLDRETTHNFVRYLKDTHKVENTWDIFMTSNVPYFSLYNSYGSYILKHDKFNKYNKYVNAEILRQYPNFYICKSYAVANIPEVLSQDNDKILIASYPRSGYNLVHNILNRYFKVKFCRCNTDNLEVNHEHRTFHRDHDMNLDVDKSNYNKFIIIYRKDLVEQMDAHFRYSFRKTTHAFLTLQDHTSCKDQETPYESQKEWIGNTYKNLQKWLEKWVNTPTENSMLIEYSDFMKNPVKILTEIYQFVNHKVDNKFMDYVNKELAISYKNTMKPERYTELSNLLSSL